MKNKLQPLHEIKMLECLSVARHYRGVKREGKLSSVFIMYVQNRYFSALLCEPADHHASITMQSVHVAIEPWCS